MCYTAEAGTQIALKYAKHRGDVHAIEELELELERLQILKEPKFHVSGFTHPKLLVFTNEAPFKPQEFVWGLIPGWTKTLADGMKFWNNTLNARGETIFEKPSFRSSAKSKRCLIYVDAFYEFHHYSGKKYPFRIAMKDKEPITFAGLWEEWVDKQSGEIWNTCTIVTTVGNPLMTKIHNNPKAEGPRMPVILSKDVQDEWLIDCKTDQDKKHLESLIKPFPEDLLEAHTVRPLLGKSAAPNTAEVEKEYVYPEIKFNL